MSPTTQAHEAIVAATMLGIVKAKAGLRVTVAELSAAPSPASADVLVFTDAGRETDVPTAIARLRAALDGDGVLALVVGSPVTRSLVALAQPDLVTTLKGRDDPYARAVVWAAARPAHAALAPALDPERLDAIVLAASSSGLALVEPDLAVASPGLARLRGMQSPRARALVATVALGAGARPLLFVPSRGAPKGGLARAKVERLADGWVEGTPTRHEHGAATDIVTAARAILRDGYGPGPFKDLLREARDRWTADARAAGGRATPSSADARDLAAALHRLAGRGEVSLFALNPSAPGWTLTVL